MRYAHVPPEIPEHIKSNDILRFYQLAPPLFDIDVIMADEIVELAEKVCANEWNIFGLKYHSGENTNWHKCPKTGNTWPLRYWGDVPIRDGFSVGGVKFVWELNRLYCLPILGLAQDLTGLNKYGDKIFSLLTSWLDANQYPLGVNWTSGIELSVRVANLCWGLSYLKEYEFSNEQIKLINDFLWLHGRHLYRYQSKYSSNNNHAIAEAFGLFLIGTLSSPFPETVKWFSFGKHVLEQECARQLLPDGGSYEYSTTYLSFVVDFFLLFKLVCERLGIAFNPVVNHRLKTCCTFIHNLLDSQGNCPNIGDQDSAVLVNFGLDNHQNLKSILNTGAVLFNEKKFVNGGFPDIKTSLLLGEEILSSFNYYPPKKSTKSYPTIQTQLFKESGLAIIRREDCTGEIVFVGNATPMGMPPLYAHGHLDALSFYLSVYGKEIFIDPGTYLYHSGGKWRRYFRSTAAHNTLRVNHLDFSEMPGDFMFGKPYDITHHSLTVADGVVAWCAEHNAYHRMETPVRHRRMIEWHQDCSQLQLIDEVKGEGEYLVELFFHFHPHCTVSLNQQQVVIKNDTVHIGMDCMESLEIEVNRGSEVPLLGWFSHSFNQVEKTTTLVCRQKVRGHMVFRNTITIE